MWFKQKMYCSEMGTERCARGRSFSFSSPPYVRARGPTMERLWALCCTSAGWWPQLILRRPMGHGGRPNLVEARALSRVVRSLKHNMGRASFLCSQHWASPLLDMISSIYCAGPTHPSRHWTSAATGIWNRFTGICKIDASKHLRPGIIPGLPAYTNYKLNKGSN